MESLLFLAHRIPYPPNKGDKIRSYHFFRYLASRYRVYLGTFVDNEDDLQHLGRLREMCADLHVARLDPRGARIRSLSALIRGEPLTLPYYRDPALQRWVEATVQRHGIRKVVVFSSAMDQYVEHIAMAHRIVDFVDVDSAKWSQYAQERPWPLSAVYRREGRRLLAFERAVAARADACVLVTPAEVELFARLAPETRAKLHAIGNGVDCENFAVDNARRSPFAANEAAIVFTGVMDYWPNVDAVTWFAREVLPRIVAARPDVRFYVVGMNPSATVQSLAADPRIVVTGKVSDVRPYLQHCAAVVAPLRVARGVQNKVLEAMAMARPVVVSTAAAQGIAGDAGIEFEHAAEAPAYAAAVLRVLERLVGDRMGELARARVQRDYSWQASLQALGDLVESAARTDRRCAG